MVVVDVDHGHCDRVGRDLCILRADQEPVVGAELPRPEALEIGREWMPVPKRIVRRQLSEGAGSLQGLDPPPELALDVGAPPAHLPLVRTQLLELAVLVPYFQRSVTDLVTV